MVFCTVQALGEMAVLFPVNGAFYTYIVRFVDPSLYVKLPGAGRHIV
jgi:amino acid transporter